MTRVQIEVPHDDPMPRVVAVVGLGIVGGSLVRALARLPDRPRVLGASPDLKDRQGAAREPGLVTFADGAEAVGEADLVVYAAPLTVVIDLLAAHAKHIRPDATVTDVAGLKLPVLEAARNAGLGGRFVGSHPMAGAEGAGFEGGRADLFRAARVWLCSDEPVETARAMRMEEFWRAVGARPKWIDPEPHDRMMVEVSHLPQLVSNALALTLEGAGTKEIDLGPGGRDMTRLAGSPPRMWADLLAHTAPDAARLLRKVGAKIEELAALLDEGDIEGVSQLMARTRAWRDGVEEGVRRGGR